MWPFTRKPDRNIFSFWDGVRRRRVDPLLALRAFDRHPTFNFDEQAELVKAGEFAATKLAVDATREIFAIPAWSETEPGLTEAETILVLWQFITFNQLVKKNTNPAPFSPASTQEFSAGSTPKPHTDSG